MKIHIFPGLTCPSRNLQINKFSVMLHYVTLNRLFVKSTREILNGMEHVAIMLTTLKEEKVT